MSIVSRIAPLTALSAFVANMIMSAACWWVHVISGIGQPPVTTKVALTAWFLMNVVLGLCVLFDRD